MMLFAGTNGVGVPARGQILPVSQNPYLYSLLGTLYGGDGINTFQLPDMRPITPNNMAWYICDKGTYPTNR